MLRHNTTLFANFWETQGRSQKNGSCVFLHSQERAKAILFGGATILFILFSTTR